MQCINSLNYNNNISFGIFFNRVTDIDGNMVYRGDTQICRNDLYFPEVVDFLEQKYKNTPKVNVVMHACSDGEEVYSFLGVLKSRLGNKKAEKYTPVLAKDIDYSHLLLAQKGVYMIGKGEFEIANGSMNGKFYDYFKFLNRNDVDNKMWEPHNQAYSFIKNRYVEKVSVKDELRKLAKFEQGNILEDAKRFDFKNTVLFARNFWPYLSDEEQKELAKTLARRTDESFTLIIGDYDKEEGIDVLLEVVGFTEVAENIFEKTKNCRENRLKIYNYVKNSLYK